MLILRNDDGYGKTRISFLKKRQNLAARAARILFRIFAVLCMSPNFKFDVLTTNECERTNASLSFYFFNSETARIFYFWDNSPTLYDVHERDGVCTKTFVSTKLYFEVTFSSKSSKSLLIFQNISFFHGISK